MLVLTCFNYFQFFMKFLKFDVLYLAYFTSFVFLNFETSVICFRTTFLINILKDSRSAFGSACIVLPLTADQWQT